MAVVVVDAQRLERDRDRLRDLATALVAIADELGREMRAAVPETVAA